MYKSNDKRACFALASIWLSKAGSFCNWEEIEFSSTKRASLYLRMSGFDEYILGVINIRLPILNHFVNRFRFPTSDPNDNDNDSGNGNVNGNVNG